MWVGCSEGSRYKQLIEEILIPDKRVRGSLVAGVRAHLTQSGDTVPKG